MADGPRIAVVGTSGSGKTVLAEQVAQQLGIRHVELDALYWGPDWEPVPFDVFRQRITEALNGYAWVVDGNYSKVRDIAWARVQTVVWLDYPLVVVLARLICRTVRRSLTGEELWSGNREELCRALASRDSIVLWALRTYWRRRREYPTLAGQPQYAHLTFVRLKSPGAARKWLAGLCDGISSPGQGRERERK
ncbi:MAG: adenylate kinase [Anaerolineales bacterium]|nr:adenylate kinase [Anaerolineales bacterium]